ncbi:accessory factor UbiK family protein [Psychrosphaera sp. B3R10]|uniref:ubiquinone biosynthesis accessory factor UbiK n=1 Tax=unclassified Psychrosphaera TaxID=2641570 RepID=UPI001C09FE5A|nr:MULTISPECIES: accessory factor UbiK family protein [unclassified Psychrosphaera]MBU2883074.1 accessory factor UbiK family protein [Psychrosphaera sp. I2R16]MBU2988531.1 accessory factor UbiK family protein [Psychrosphaera sp. B3R10]
MLDAKKIEQIAEQITNVIPPGVKTLADNVEEKIKTVLQAKLSQLDVVSREEFDVQTQVLARTRQKLDLLEKEFEQIKQQFADTTAE